MEKWTKGTRFNVVTIVELTILLLALIVLLFYNIGDVRKKNKIDKIVNDITDTRGYDNYCYGYENTNMKNIYIIHLYYERQVGSYVRTYIVNIADGSYYDIGEE